MLRFAFRSLRKNPGFTFVAIVNSVLLRPLPFKDPDQLVWIWSRRPDNNKAPFSLPDFLDHRDQNQTLDQIAAFGNIGLSLSGVERTDRLQGQRVSANLFQLLGVDAEHGRLMLVSDDEPGQRHVVVLTHEMLATTILWRSEDRRQRQGSAPRRSVFDLHWVRSSRRYSN